MRRRGARAGAGLAAAAVFACRAIPAVAAVPDWARAIADAPPPITGEAPSVPARVLLSETRETLRPDGTVHQRRRFATQVLSARTSDVDTGFFAFDDQTQVTASRAWHLPPGEDKVRRNHSVAVDVSPDDAFLSGNRVRVLKVGGVRKGSLIFFEFEAIERPPFLSFSHRFYEGAPVLIDRFEVETPPGWSLRATWVGRTGPEAVRKDNVSIWELRDLPMPVEELLADEPPDLAPLLYVQPLPPAVDGAVPRGFPFAFSDWRSMSIWYEQLSRDRHDPAGIEAVIRGRVPGSEAGFFDRVKAAALLVRDDVRYTAIELGIGGYQPRPAAETLANLYGDCKDKGTLFQAVLSAAGIPSHAVLIHAGPSDPVPDAFPAWAFNHFVVAVPLPDGVKEDARFTPALFTAPEHGRMIIVDTTDEHTAIGSLSAALAGHRGLLVDGERGSLVTLRPADPDVNRVLRRVECELRADRSTALRRVTRMWGEFAAAARAEQAHSAIERRRRVEQSITGRWPEAAVSDYVTVPEDDEGAFEERLAIGRAAAHTGAFAPDLVGLFPWLEGDIPRAPLGRRAVPVVYPDPIAVRHEAAITGLPADAPLPQAQRLAGEGWTVSIECRRDGSIVRAVAEVRLSRTRFNVDAFPELRRFWSAVGVAASAAVARGLPG